MCYLLYLIFAISVTSCFGSRHSSNTREAAEGCVLPQHPQNGKWSIYRSTDQLSPGDKVPSNTILQISCRNNYAPDGDFIAICASENWTSKIGSCLRTCPPLFSTSVMTVICTHNNKTLEHCTNAINQTEAWFTCADFYEDQSLERHPVRVCNNGKWSNRSPKCVPVCGQKTSGIEVVEGKNVTISEYPWQVALYNSSDKTFLCSGSLINARVILTVAHCIVDDDELKLYPTENFLVGVGKYFQKYDDARDFKYAQFSGVHQMSVEGNWGQFIGENTEIAIVVTKKTFQLSSRVLPVCVEWTDKYTENLLDPLKNPYGYVNGWSFNDEHNESSFLTETKVPLFTGNECVKKMRSHGYYDRHIRLGTSCVGFRSTSRPVCTGNSGISVVAQYKNRYYIMGLISNSRPFYDEIEACNNQNFTIFTIMSSYRKVDDFNLKKERQFRPDAADENFCLESLYHEYCINELSTISTTESRRCILPENPKFGWWVVSTNGTFYPGDAVNSRTVLTVICYQSHRLNGSSSLICKNGIWSSDIGECLKMCPPMLNTPTTTVTCLDKNNVTVHCTDAVDGTVAKFKCAQFYEHWELKTKQTNELNITCRDGRWDHPTPRCTPICGQKSVEATVLIVNGTNAKKGDYPWQVALYTTNDKELICSGSLLSENVVLTAAHCLTNERGNLLPKENYMVAVGTYYRKFNHTQDVEDAQFSAIKKIHITEHFQGHIQNYFGDIAVIITVKPFVLSRRVQPVCLDKRHFYTVQDNTEGYVTGWGFTAENSKLSAVLKEMRVPKVSISKCRQGLPEDYEIYLTFDKMCAGYLDKQISVCKGDSGGGLVFKHDGRYYLTGIVSLSPTSPTMVNGCDTRSYGMYTKVAHYIDDLLRPKLEW